MPTVKLSSLFALTLAACIFCGLYSPSYSQSPATAQYKSLVEKVQEDVAQQLEIDEEVPTDAEIEKLYWEDAEAAGLTYRELITLYKKEYAEQKAAQKPSLLEQLIPRISVLLGLPSLVGLVYITLLKKWIEARIKSIGDWAYRQGAGTRLFRNIALRKYRAALVANNEKLPMPFLKNRDPLKMEDVYVPLKVSESQQDSAYQPANASTMASKQQNIDANRAVTDYRRLMVIGEPGSGKSILLKYLAWAYGLDKLTALEDRPVVVLLELYRLSDPALNEAKLIAAITEAFGRNDFPNAQNFVRTGLEKGIFLLLLDGLDEVNSDVRSHVVGVIRDLLKGKWKKCRVVITCRTAVYEGEFSDIAERKLEVIEFTDQQMRQFLKAWEPEMVQARKSVNQMMAALRERPLILKLARNPLLLTLIAYLYTEPAFVLPRSRAEFYEKSTGILLEQREYKGDDEYKHNRYEANEKRRVLQHLALYAQDQNSALSSEIQDRRSIKAEIIRAQVKVVLPSLDISEGETKDILDEIVERSGLFTKIDGGERYVFPHLTIQEYFAATALKDEETQLVDRFVADPAAWREVVKLWCSLANESTSLVSSIYQRDAITGFECLAEARQVDQSLANQIIERFKPELEQPQNDETLARAFGSVAANSRSRGKSVFEFLEQTLLDPQTSETHQATVADALSRTNLPKAAAVLTQWYGDSKPIVRMGDLVVTTLAELAQQGNLQAIDDLNSIGTPDAAMALVPLLWNQPEAVLSRTSAAWYLGGLLTQADVEDSLRTYELASEQRQSERLDWVWQPFEETSNASLTVIAGRIAHLLQHNLLSDHIQQLSPYIDPRLVIPLCTFQLSPALPIKKLPPETETLLEQTNNSSQTKTQCLNIIHKVLGKQRISTTKTQWFQLLSALAPQIQLDLLYRLAEQDKPTRSHWSG